MKHTKIKFIRRYLLLGDKYTVVIYKSGRKRIYKEKQYMPMTVIYFLMNAPKITKQYHPSFDLYETIYEL